MTLIRKSGDLVQMVVVTPSPMTSFTALKPPMGNVGTIRRGCQTLPRKLHAGRCMWPPLVPSLPPSFSVTLPSFSSCSSSSPHSSRRSRSCCRRTTQSLAPRSGNSVNLSGWRRSCEAVYSSLCVSLVSALVDSIIPSLIYPLVH